MAYAVSLDELVTQAEQMADMEGSTFVSAAEWRTYANRWIAKLYDLLIQASPDYIAAETTLTVVAGQTSYLLPGDFRTMQSVLAATGDTKRRLEPLLDDERHLASPPRIGASLVIEYLPAPPRLASGADTFDVISGWDQLVVAGMARDALAKEESDTSVADMIIQTEGARIQSTSSNRDRGQPKMIGFPRHRRRQAWWADMATGGDLRYRLRGGNLEVYSL